ncbi:hypothetical protein PR202_ga24782 [Eleusine coracana subsp. coracana]|uniref:RING-type domain-containing protein n=1 Tax=Eleusine coracana subsp. coracana TaxID=191504 RepID=A0AAV5D9P3_ELECO|nr:hypothetical protein PR202_ga24782 [Eleusine coracana subsp. coracana]
MGDVDADDVDHQSAGFDGFDLDNNPELQRLLDLLASQPADERRHLTAIAELERQEYITNMSSTRKRKRGHGTRGEEEEGVMCECPVCLEEFTVGDDLIMMPCKHRYHERCMVKWLALSRLCPCCRHALPCEDKAEQVSIISTAVTVLHNTTSNRRYPQLCLSQYTTGYFIHKVGGKARRDSPSTLMAEILTIQYSPDFKISFGSLDFTADSKQTPAIHKAVAMFKAAVVQDAARGEPQLVASSSHATSRGRQRSDLRNSMRPRDGRDIINSHTDDRRDNRWDDRRHNSPPRGNRDDRCR